MDEYPYPDNFGNNVVGSRLPGAEGQDHINFQFNLSLNEETGLIDLTKTPVMSESKNHLWKYNEDKIQIGRAHV